MTKTRAARWAGSPSLQTKYPSLGVRCIGNVRGEPCTHENGGPAWAVVKLDGRAMCPDHRRGYRMLKTIRASGGSRQRLRGASGSLGRCVGNVNGEPCTHDGGGPAVAVIKLEGRGMCAHHRRGYRAHLTNSGPGWASEVPKGSRVLYAIITRGGRPMVKIGKAMSSTLASRSNGARLSAGRIGLHTLLAGTVAIRDRPVRGASGPLSLSYEHAVRLVVATALRGRLGAHKTEWVEVPQKVFQSVNWQLLLERAVAWVDLHLLPVEGAGSDLLRRTILGKQGRRPTRRSTRRPRAGRA